MRTNSMSDDLVRRLRAMGGGWGIVFPIPVAIVEHIEALEAALRLWEQTANESPFCSIGHAMEHCECGKATRAALEAINEPR